MKKIKKIKANNKFNNKKINFLNKFHKKFKVLMVIIKITYNKFNRNSNKCLRLLV